MHRRPRCAYDTIVRAECPRHQQHRANAYSKCGGRSARVPRPRPTGHRRLETSAPSRADNSGSTRGTLARLGSAKEAAHTLRPAASASAVSFSAHHRSQGPQNGQRCIQASQPKETAYTRECQPVEESWCFASSRCGGFRADSHSGRRRAPQATSGQSAHPAGARSWHQARAVRSEAGPWAGREPTSHGTEGLSGPRRICTVQKPPRTEARADYSW
jgi:hypothetical protein